MSETSDDIAHQLERDGHRAIALTDATCKGRAKDVQPPLSAEQIAAILADYRATVARTAHGGGAEDFASLAAWLPVLIRRVGVLEGVVAALSPVIQFYADIEVWIDEDADGETAATRDQGHRAVLATHIYAALAGRADMQRAIAALAAPGVAAATGEE